MSESMFDDDDVDEAFNWGAIHILHSYAWHAQCGRIPGVRVSLAMRLIDAIKDDRIDEHSAPAYIDVLQAAYENDEPARWD